MKVDGFFVTKKLYETRTLNLLVVTLNFSDSRLIDNYNFLRVTLEDKGKSYCINHNFEFTKEGKILLGLETLSDPITKRVLMTTPERNLLSLVKYGTDIKDMLKDQVISNSLMLNPVVAALKNNSLSLNYYI